MLTYLREVLSKKDNFLSLLSITLVLVIVIADVFGDGFNPGTAFELILVILGLISLSQIVEREARFESVNNKLEARFESVNNKLEARFESANNKLEARFESVNNKLNAIENTMVEMKRPSFITVNDLTPLTELMKYSQELFYTGGHLRAFIQNNTNNFDKWLKEGKSIRLILQDPRNEGLMKLEMPCVNYNSEAYVAQINESLRILEQLHKSYPAAKLGVRVASITPTQSVSIIDGHIGGTSLGILHHLPNGESSSAPFTYLDPVKDQKWFELFYQRYYRYLWDVSRVVISHPDDAQN
ncbi:MAG: hypothetical protein AAFZ17_15710 [Cyanobacteria bacterium J06650_10]